MEQLIEFLSNHPVLTGAWVLVAALLLVAQFKHMTSGIKALTPLQATQLINRESGVVIDVRPIADFNKGHIAGAINIPQSKISTSTVELEKYKSTPIILVCANGIQAGSACQELKKAGFEIVHKLMGGFQSWIGENLPVVKK